MNRLTQAVAIKLQRRPWMSARVILKRLRESRWTSLTKRDLNRHLYGSPDRYVHRLGGAGRRPLWNLAIELSDELLASLLDPDPATWWPACMTTESACSGGTPLPQPWALELIVALFEREFDLAHRAQLVQLLRWHGRSVIDAAMLWCRPVICARVSGGCEADAIVAKAMPGYERIGMLAVAVERRILVAA